MEDIRSRHAGAGTENMIGITAFGKACEIARLGMEEQNTKIESLRGRLLEGIRAAIGEVTLNGDPVEEVTEYTQPEF